MTTPSGKPVRWPVLVFFLLGVLGFVGEITSLSYEAYLAAWMFWCGLMGSAYAFSRALKDFKAQYDKQST